MMWKSACASGVMAGLRGSRSQPRLFAQGCTSRVWGTGAVTLSSSASWTISLCNSLLPFMRIDGVSFCLGKQFIHLRWRVSQLSTWFTDRELKSSIIVLVAADSSEPKPLYTIYPQLFFHCIMLEESIICLTKIFLKKFFFFTFLMKKLGNFFPLTDITKCNVPLPELAVALSTHLCLQPFNSIMILSTKPLQVKRGVMHTSVAVGVLVDKEI